jgi:hypothetical protein
MVMFLKIESKKGVEKFYLSSGTKKSISKITSL